MRGNLLTRMSPNVKFFYWSEAVLGHFYWPGASSSLLASNPARGTVLQVILKRQIQFAIACSIDRHTQLASASSDVCVAICDSIGKERKVRLLNQYQRSQLKDACITCLVSLNISFCFLYLLIGKFCALRRPL